MECRQKSVTADLCRHFTISHAVLRQFSGAIFPQKSDVWGPSCQTSCQIVFIYSRALNPCAASGGWRFEFSVVLFSATWIYYEVVIFQVTKERNGRAQTWLECTQANLREADPVSSAQASSAISPLWVKFSSSGFRLTVQVKRKMEINEENGIQYNFWVEERFSKKWKMSKPETVLVEERVPQALRKSLLSKKGLGRPLGLNMSEKPGRKIHTWIMSRSPPTLFWALWRQRWFFTGW